MATALGSKMNETWIYAGVLWGVRGIIIYAVRRGAYERKGMFFRFLDFARIIAQRSAAREGHGEKENKSPESMCLNREVRGQSRETSKPPVAAHLRSRDPSCRTCCGPAPMTLKE